MTALIRPMQAGEAAECENILRSLPEWFGIEEAILDYREAIAAMETHVATLEGRIAGFVTLQFHNEHSAEIHVMAVRAEFHRQGVGRALVDCGVRQALARSAEYLEVKTLGPSRESLPYARTRAFYLSRGFLPLEENLLIWGRNPCLIMIRHLRCQNEA